MEIGQRVRELRLLRAWTQRELAQHSGLGLSTVRKLEQDAGDVSMTTLHAIARALEVETLVLVPHGRVSRQDLDLADLRNAVDPPMSWNGPVFQAVEEGLIDLRKLCQSAQALANAYKRNRLDFVRRAAPGILRAAHSHVEKATANDRQTAQRARGEILGIIGQYLVQVREDGLALLALKAALNDAVAVSNQALAATMISLQAWALLRQARFREAEDLCLATAKQIEPAISSDDYDQLGAWGRLMLRSAAAASRNNRPYEARQYVSQATAAGMRIGREVEIAGHLTFGPLTAAVMGPEVELIGGRPDRALQLARQLPYGVGRTPSDMPRHKLDCALALTLTGEADQATEVLLKLKRRAPEWLRHQRFARDVVREIVSSRRRRISKQQRALVNFLGPL